MKLLQKYLPVVGGFMALTVLTASSGLTIVLEVCSMQQSSCCLPSPGLHQNGCASAVTPALGHTLTADFTCHSKIVAGGLAIRLAVLEKQIKPDAARIIASHVAVFSPRLTLHIDRSFPLLLCVEADPSPPLEKYVLNASFLI